MEKGDTRIAFGIMGGWNQAQAHAQFVANLVDFNMNVQAAMEAARFSKETFSGCDVQMEARIAADRRDGMLAVTVGVCHHNVAAINILIARECQAPAIR